MRRRYDCRAVELPRLPRRPVVALRAGAFQRNRGGHSLAAPAPASVGRCRGDRGFAAGGAGALPQNRRATPGHARPGRGDGRGRVQQAAGYQGADRGLRAGAIVQLACRQPAENPRRASARAGPPSRHPGVGGRGDHRGGRQRASHPHQPPGSRSAEGEPAGRVGRDGADAAAARQHYRAVLAVSPDEASLRVGVPARQPAPAARHGDRPGAHGRGRGLGRGGGGPGHHSRTATRADAAAVHQ